MPVIPDNVDWSATAAWIALAISIIGTICSPIITSWLNNRFQLKLYELKSESDRIDKINDERNSSLRAFLSSVGKSVTYSSVNSLAELGSVFSTVYPYIPEKHWEELDRLYGYIINDKWESARDSYLFFTHVIADLLKEPLR